MNFPHSIVRHVFAMVVLLLRCMAYVPHRLPNNCNDRRLTEFQRLCRASVKRKPCGSPTKTVVRISHHCGCAGISHTTTPGLSPVTSCSAICKSPSSSTFSSTTRPFRAYHLFSIPVRCNCIVKAVSWPGQHRPVDCYRSSFRLALVKMARKFGDVRRRSGMDAVRGRSRRINAIEAVTGALNLKALFVRSTAFVLALAAASFVGRADAFVYWTESSRNTIGRANHLDGSAVNVSFISGLNRPQVMAIDGTY